MTRARIGPAIILSAAVGLAIAAYLLISRLSGGPPACGIYGGCEEVAFSEYSTFLGIPVALYGVGYSIVVLALALVWWRSGDRRALLGAYGLGLLGVITVAYLTYLELFVIEAICVWCVAYAVTVVVTFALATIAVIRTN